MRLNLFLLILNGVQTLAWGMSMLVIPHTNLGTSVLFVTEISLYSLVLSSFIAAIVAFSAWQSERRHRHLSRKIAHLEESQ